MKQALKTAILAAAISTALGGCGSMPKMDMGSLNPFDSTPSAEITAKYKDSTPEQAVSAAKAALDKAKKEHLSFYAPSHYDDAVEALEDAQALLDKKKKANDIFEETYKVEESIAKGMKTKAKVQQELKEVLALKSSLEKRDVKKSYADAFEDLMSDVSDMIEDIEAGKADGITKDRQQATKALQALEVKVVKYNAMHQADIVFQQAQELDGEKLAPKTFKAAAEAQKLADTFIELNPYNEEGVTKEAADYAFAANHALHVTKEVRRLQEVDKKTLEAEVLTQEERLLDISEALGAADNRDKDLSSQVAAIVSAAKGLIGKNQSLSANVDELGKSVNTLDDIKKENLELVTKVNNLKVQMSELEANNKSLTDEKIYLTTEMVSLKTKLEKAEIAISALSVKPTGAQATPVSASETTEQMTESTTEAADKEETTSNETTPDTQGTDN